MYKSRVLKPLLFSVLVASFLSQTAFAVSLTDTHLSGMLLIDAGVKAPKQKTLADGSVVTVNSYSGGSYFAMGSNRPNSSNAVMLSPGTAGGILLGTYQNFVTNPDVPHPQGWKGDTNGDGIAEGAAGTGYAGLVTESTAFSSFKFFGTNTYIGLNPLSYQSAATAAAPGVGIDMSSCTNNVCSIYADFSAWEVYWNGSVFQQGPRPSNTGLFGLASGSYNLISKEYSLDWASQIKDGPFNNVTGYWHIEGTVVPVPAAVWLFASGLTGLFAFARRRREKA
ncbi:hypothetical protein MNBD_GAMMA09-1122 [hydrothermal vent metagenome]|uniref:PEP-CTERM protein-sorting domain-containing protein n=1 Tax=hydrothermal vent metagenome TaxID=652676 RepID=A0A3B0X7W3_9ZZZZ